MVSRHATSKLPLLVQGVRTSFPFARLGAAPAVGNFHRSPLSFTTRRPPLFGNNLPFSLNITLTSTSHSFLSTPI